MSGPRPISFNGVHLFTVTPTGEDGAIAPGKLRAHVDRAVEAGIASVTAFGSSGGIGSFDESERMAIADAVVDATAGRLPVVVGTGAMTTAACIRLSLHARKAGADAILVVPTTYWPLSEQELLDHYNAVADESGMPMVLYNNPRTTGVDMPPAFLARLCEIPMVVAVKESGPDVTRIAELVRFTKGRIPVLTGRDPQALEALMVGSAGWFSGGANFMPEFCVRLYKLYEAGQYSEARALMDKFYPLTSYTIAKGGIRCAHTALELQGRSLGAPRLPLQMLHGADRDKLREHLDAVGLLPTAA